MSKSKPVRRKPGTKPGTKLGPRKPKTAPAEKPSTTKKAQSPSARAAESVRRPATEAKLDNLLAEAAKLMATKGYDNTSIRDVARATGYSLAGMYYYFESKEDLLYQIQFNTFSRLVDEQEAALARVGDQWDKIHTVVQTYLGFFARHRNELKICAFEIESLKGDAYERVRDVRHRWYELVADIVADITELNRRTVHDEKLVRHHTLFIFGMLNWIFMWFDDKRDMPLHQLGLEMVTMIFNGLPSRFPHSKRR
ncbi:MAG: TetR family transcriptional regulator [Planctomycetota bacterium]